MTLTQCWPKSRKAHPLRWGFLLLGKSGLPNVQHLAKHTPLRWGFLGSSVSPVNGFPLCSQTPPHPSGGFSDGQGHSSPRVNNSQTPPHSGGGFSRPRPRLFQALALSQRPPHFGGGFSTEEIRALVNRHNLAKHTPLWWGFLHVSGSRHGTIKALANTSPLRWGFLRDSTSLSTLTQDLANTSPLRWG